MVTNKNENKKAQIFKKMIPPEFSFSVIDF